LIHTPGITTCIPLLSLRVDIQGKIYRLHVPSWKLHHLEAPRPVTLFRVDSRRYKLRDCQLLEKYAWNWNLTSPVPLFRVDIQGKIYKRLQEPPASCFKRSVDCASVQAGSAKLVLCPLKLSFEPIVESLGHTLQGRFKVNTSCKPPEPTSLQTVSTTTLHCIHSLSSHHII
jgi:hypothetical protein